MILIIGFSFALVLMALSYVFWDQTLSLFFYRWMHANDALLQAAAGIPDLLAYVVIIITLVSWGLYFLLTRRGYKNRHTQFLQLCGTAVPAAFIFKSFLQFVLGRSNPWMWAIYHQSPIFYWFDASEGYGCFPSGHMTVFTALIAGFGYYYPRYRLACFSLLLLLAVALIVTNHHFLSDVIAGASLGMAIFLLANNALNPIAARKPSF
ncbi:MAG: phosphatase PAP2 family protein [Gammaproteobacteria bacterium]|nr:phosphatase PAP2 family protein [Gammaproteobacteria bacterium]